MNPPRKLASTDITPSDHDANIELVHQDSITCIALCFLEFGIQSSLLHV